MGALLSDTNGSRAAGGGGPMTGGRYGHQKGKWVVTGGEKGTITNFSRKHQK